MKKILSGLLFFNLLFLTSCSEQESQSSISVDDLIAKWNINSGGISSIEFNISNTYILVEESTLSPQIKYGNFDVIDDSVLLDGFGQFDNVQISGNQIEFTLEVDDAELPISGVKNDDIIESNNLTGNLFKTWKLLLVNEVPVAGTEDELHVFISRAGTYFVTFINDEDANFLSNWNWKSIDENVFCYSHDGETLCETNENLVNILTLTESELVADDLDEGEVATFEAL